MELPKLRSVSPRDIVVGNRIYYSGETMDDGEWHMFTVEQVLHPDDPWKAFTAAEDGCRYGLYGAYVQVVPEDSDI